MNSKIKKISIGSANFGQRYTLNKIMLNQKQINKILESLEKINDTGKIDKYLETRIISQNFQRLN